LSSSEISTIAGYSATGAPTPTPTATPTTTPTPGATPSFNNWATYGYDNNHDGYNPNSSAITPASLANLHLAWELTLPNSDYNTQTQPILATNLGGHAGILIVGGSLGNVYGYDALTGSQVWSTAVGSASISCGGANPVYQIAVGGSAVYDPSSGYVYVPSNHNDGTTNAQTQLYVNQLNAASGSLVQRVNFAPSMLTGEVDLAHTSLTLGNGNLYAGTGSNCDLSSWRGRVVAITESSMALSTTFYTAWDQSQAPSPAPTPLSGGGVWGWGGVSIDPNGHVWTAVGNVDTNSGSSGPQTPFVQTSTEYAAFGEHVLELSGGLSTEMQNDYPGFTFNSGLSNDLDISGTPVLAQPVGCDDALAVQGKSGYLYLYDTTNIGSGPAAKYEFTSSSYNDPNLGNPGYSPLTGMYYASVGSNTSGSVTSAPGMVAVKACPESSSLVWSTLFGPDSLVAGAPRSMPTVTAGGVVLVGTPCERDGSGGCTGTSGTFGGALWALNASSGALLNGGKPLITTPSPIRMGAVVDGDWVYLFDNSGYLYGLTIDPHYAPIANRFLRAQAVQRVIHWR